MSLIKKIILFSLITFLVIIITPIKSNNETKIKTYNLTKVELNNEGFTDFYENSNFKYSYKKHNGILKVYDKRNNYTWKSGIDHDYDQYIQNRTKLLLENDPEASEEKLKEVALNIEDQMNNTREGIANSLLVFDILTPSNPSRSPLQVGSSSKSFIIIDNPENDSEQIVTERKSDSINTDNLYIDNANKNHFIFKIELKKHSIKVQLHIYIDDNGFQFEIINNEITGEDIDNIAYINIMPFMGSFGGKQLEYNYYSNEWDVPYFKERNKGYALVPDGAGGLIEFDDYVSNLSGYDGYVYGKDKSITSSNSINISSTVPLKNPLMPLYGIAYEENQAAFLSYAKSGGEYMEIISRPNDSSDSYNLTNYNITFPRFYFNGTYVKVLNQAGQSYNSLLENKLNYDIKIKYHFLSNNDGEKANYVGMASVYKKYLEDNGFIKIKNKMDQNIPIRLDFIMSDSKKSLIGYDDVVVTNIKQVEKILLEVKENGINNINSGIIGYQKGGISLGSLSNPKFTNQIGTKNDFTRVIKNLNENNIDISLSNDFKTINSEQINLKNNAAKHINGLYLTDYSNELEGKFITEYNYLKPSKIENIVDKNVKNTNKINYNSLTFDGFTNNLYSEEINGNYDLNNTITMYKDLLNKYSLKYKINATTPNMYLWDSVDRFLQTPMFSSQYIVITKEVPFLQMILSDNMELYSTYVNFSFYEQKDILKLIDYNTFPSFILTAEPSHLLTNTNSSNYYSTEYEIYKEMILEVYNNINFALKNTNNAKWINRVEISENIFVNEYDNNIKIVINYSNKDINYLGKNIKAQNYLVIGE